MSGSTTAAASSRPRVVAGAFLLGVRAYRALLAPVLPRACRFEPSCSAYAEEALSKHRLPTALRLIVLRILRCHPFHRGGYDPVP